MAEIGKNVIENLTTAMYDNPFTIYREYIQNSADSIDKAVEEKLEEKSKLYIDVNVDCKNSNIIILDNACGIRKADFDRLLLTVADSSKSRINNKGFRGIGRLAGLAYCSKLKFESTVKGETTKSVIVWDGALLRKVLSDSSQHPSASDLIDSIVTKSCEKTDSKEHFFKVSMIGVYKENLDLLNVDKVRGYLEEVAPIPYKSSFIFKSKIKDFAKENDFKIDEYRINVNGKSLDKPYSADLYKNTKKYDEITAVEFKIIKGEEGKPLAWMWYGLSKFAGVIPTCNKMHGIRLRKGNIEIGDAKTLERFYSETRGNKYFIGEVYAISAELIPNARRDYFNSNRSLNYFEQKMRIECQRLTGIYKQASNYRSAQNSIQAAQKKEFEFRKKEQNAGFIDSAEKEKLRTQLEECKKKAEAAKRDVAKLTQKSNGNETLVRVFENINKGYAKENPVPNEEKHLKEQENSAKKKSQYITAKLSKYSKSERKLISQIYSIINNILPQDEANCVITKIQEELQKK